jgi:hypothetical protein
MFLFIWNLWLIFSFRGRKHGIDAALLPQNNLRSSGHASPGDTNRNAAW